MSINPRFFLLLLLITLSFSSISCDVFFSYNTDRIEMSLKSYNFGNHDIDTTPSKGFNVINNNTRPITLTSVSFNSSSSSQFSVNPVVPANQIVGANSRFTITVEFNPVFPGGSVQGTLVIDLIDNKQVARNIIVTFGGRGIQDSLPLEAYDPYPADSATEILALGASIKFTWKAGANTVTYDVYLDENITPTTQVGTALTSPEIDITPATANTTYYWRVDSTNAKGTTINSTVWSFITASLTSPPAVLINEVETGNFDYIEIYNNSGITIDISGWELHIYTYGSETNGGTVYNAWGLNGVYTFPGGTILNDTDVIVVNEKGVTGTYVMDFNIVLTDNTTPFEVILYVGDDIIGIGCDYVGANMSATYPNLPANLTFTGNLFGNVLNYNYYRILGMDNSDSGDWNERTSSPDIGTPNPNS